MSDQPENKDQNPDDMYQQTAYGLTGVFMTSILDSGIARLGLKPDVMLAGLFVELMLHRHVTEELILQSLEIAKQEAAAVEAKLAENEKLAELRESMN